MASHTLVVSYTLVSAGRAPWLERPHPLTPRICAEVSYLEPLRPRRSLHKPLPAAHTNVTSSIVQLVGDNTLIAHVGRQPCREIAKQLARSRKTWQLGAIRQKSLVGLRTYLGVAISGATRLPAIARHGRAAWTSCLPR